MKQSLLVAAFVLLTTAGGAVSAERIIPKEWRKTYNSIHYAPAVRAGNDLYLAGISGKVFNGDSAIAKQFDDAFDKLKRTLEDAGSDLSHVKEIYTWHVDLFKHAGTFLKIKSKYFPKAPYPTWTSVEIDRLPPGALLEITARAERIDGGDVLQYRDAPGKSAAKLGYTPAIVDGDLIYVAGLSGKSSGTTPEEQFRSAFETLKVELETAGSSLNDIVEMDVFLVDIQRHMATFEKVKKAFIKRPIVWHPIGIKGIVDPKGILELTVRARPSNSPKKLDVIVSDNSGKAMAARYDGTLYVASISSAPPSAGQTEKSQFSSAFEELGKVLEKLNVSFNNVVELNSYHIGMTPDRFSRFLPVKDRYLKAPYPTWNGIGVHELAVPNTLVSISVRAVEK